MQSDRFAQAKIQVPRFRSGLIERSALERQLGDALVDQRLVLLVAPAGYGKTAALSRQLQRFPPGRAVAWLTADGEDDLQRMLSHLIEALEPLDPPWRLAPEALLELVAMGRLREAAAALLNALDATDVPNGAVIVLDDLHTVADSRVFEFLGHLLEGLPQNWTLAIATRVEPPLPLGRWRARREVAEFDEAALSFSKNEVQDLWRLATGRDDPEQAARLLERTQGWVAGLCVSLEAESRTAASAPRGLWQSRRQLFDYLASEVLETLPGELQEFLLRCSLLPELTVARCEQLSGNPRAFELLEDIDRRRLFASMLGSDELTLRLHDLFREFLEERLRRLHPDEVPALLRLAAQTEGEPVRRTLMYVRAGAWDEAQQALADAAADMLASGAGAQVIRIVEQFPADLQARSPVLANVRGLCAWRNYQYDAVRSAMADAAAGFDAMGRHEDAQRARAMEALAMFFCGHMEDAHRLGQEIRSQPMDRETETLAELLDFWYEGHHGPLEGPACRLAKVVDLLEQGGSAELWFRCIARVATWLSRPGVDQQLQRMIDGARAAASDGHWSLQASVNLQEAWLFLWWGKVTEFEGARQRIEEDSQWLGESATSSIRLLWLKLADGVIRNDSDAVRATCDAMAAQGFLLERSNDVRLLCFGLVARASAAIGDWPAVRVHLSALQLDAGPETPVTQMFMPTIKAQLALHEGRVDEALTTLRELAARSAVVDVLFLDATIRAWLALAELAHGSPTTAWQALEPLIERVSASGNVGEGIGIGVKCLTELARVPWGGAASREGLSALHEWIETLHQFKGGTHERLPEPAARHEGLSTREVQVLALLADGQSNKQIARTLDLSPHTVKRHVARILERLDLASRMQAANWYHTCLGTEAGHLRNTNTKETI